MVKSYTYSLFSYSNSIQKVLDCYTASKLQFVETIYKKGNSILFLRKNDSSMEIIKEVYTDKNKNRKFLITNVETTIETKNEEYLKEVSSLLIRLGYKKLGEAEIEIYKHEASDFTVEITKTIEDEYYLIKISSSENNAEEVLNRECNDLENICDFKKPNFNF